MLHTRILTLVQVSNTSNNCLRQGRLPTLHTQIIMLVQAPNNLNNSLRRCRLPMPPTQILTLCRFPTISKFLTAVQASSNSHANPDACAGSQQFKQFLTPVQALDNSHVNPYACAGSNNAENSLCLCRLLTIHTQILTIQTIPYAGEGFQQFTCEFLRLCRFPTI
ncbi:hypothetical protein O181_035940 [Austropuccinia psidii MF-1]|uniref:Uncharacterized protein n=1 Tax=Austropuccinia psidii MF-1 TaxID=1389203 RepID=A0A9Q3HBN8_9BASI|nr:hypothetical protein [Austropuccinia psidii MF-1]